MPKPIDKISLLEASRVQFNKLNTLIETTDTTIVFPENTLNRNCKDVIAHLYHWHLLFLTWYHEGMSGKKPNMPAAGYTWKETKKLNIKINRLYSEVELNDVRTKLKTTHLQVINIIESHSENELFEKKRYHWTGSTSLAAYIISNTSSHYHWAITLIKKCTK